jgi:hypothetical protein
MDQVITYDEALQAGNNMLRPVYDISLYKTNSHGVEKRCASYKVRLAIDAGICDQTTENTTTLLYTAPAPAPQPPHKFTKKEQREERKQERKLQKEEKKQEERRQKEEKRQEKKQEHKKPETKPVEYQPSATPAPTPSKGFWETTLLFGRGTAQFTGTQTLVNGTVRTVDSYQYDLNQFKARIAHYGPRHEFDVSYAGTAGNDAGTIPGSYNACSQAIGATSIAVNGDVVVLKGDKIGLAVGGTLEQKQIRTATAFEGENSSQTNQTYSVRAGLSVGDLNKSHMITGVEYIAQPINEKYAAGNGAAYTARSSVETGPAFFFKGRKYFGVDDRGYIQLDARYAPKMHTAFSSDGQHLIADSSFMNATIEGGYRVTQHMSLIGQIKYAQTTDTFKWPTAVNPSGIKTAEYKNSGATAAVGLKWTW